MKVDKNKFWAWAYSDFLSNAARGVLAEYIVAEALDCLPPQRVEWDAYDLCTSTGLRIEVRSSAYLQTWNQKKPSVIRFDVAPKRGWYAETNQMVKSPERAADMYVFCILEEGDRSRANPLMRNQWSFIVLATDNLATNIGAQKSVGLGTLARLGGRKVPWEQLREEVNRVSIAITVRHRNEPVGEG